MTLLQSSSSPGVASALQPQLTRSALHFATKGELIPETQLVLAYTLKPKD